MSIAALLFAASIAPLGSGGVVTLPAGLHIGGKVGEGCQSIYLQRENARKETAPCGELRVLDEGTWTVWMERGNEISVAQDEVPVVRRNDTELRIIQELVPAAFVKIAGQSDREFATLIQFDERSRGFSRMNRDLGRAVALPAGRIGGVLLDASTTQATAVLKSVHAGTDGTTELTPHEPRRGASDVFVEVRSSTKRDSLPTLFLQSATSTRAADDFVDGGKHLYAVWYDVADPPVGVVAPPGSAVYLNCPLQMSRSRVSTAQCALKTKPSVALTLHLDAADTPPLSVDVSGRHIDLKNRISTRIEALDPAPNSLSISIGKWKLNRRVDLSDGRDQEITIELSPIRLSGTVRRGPVAVPATIEFRDQDDWVKVLAADDGHYEAVFWVPRDYVTRVTVQDEPNPFVDLVRVETSGVRDFNLPRSRYHVHVVTEKGEPVPNADVAYENTWQSDEYGQQNVFLHTKTDEHGYTILPPLRAGTVVLTAEAKGYARSDAYREVVDSDAERSIDLTLKPVGDTARLTLTFRNLPAINVESMIVSSTDQVLWRGTTSADGSIEIPRTFKGAVILARQANAATIARRFEANDDVWQFDAPAPPLAFRVVPSREMRPRLIAVWINGLRLTGNALAFATWSAPVIGRDGIWIAQHLPQQPLRVLVWQHAAAASILSGSFDAVATDVVYPWPQLVDVRPVD